MGHFPGTKLFWTAAAISLGGIGCSLLPTEGERLPEGAFRGTAAIRAQTMPLPVEIATDISRITAEGEIEREKSIETEKARQQSRSEEKKPEGQSSGETVTSMNESHPVSGRKKFSRRTASDGKSESYQIRPGDTLMKIAFSKLGSVYRWREIYDANRDVLSNHNRIPIGSTIVIHGVEFLVVEKNGEPYLIRRGDTLRRISSKLYGTPDRWRDLWKNNSRLIRHPDRIYAGFVMYYQPLGNLATQQNSRQPSSGGEKDVTGKNMEKGEAR